MNFFANYTFYVFLFLVMCQVFVCIWALKKNHPNVVFFALAFTLGYVALIPLTKKVNEKNYLVEARMANRAISEDEQKKLATSPLVGTRIAIAKYSDSIPLIKSLAEDSNVTVQMWADANLKVKKVIPYEQTFKSNNKSFVVLETILMIIAVLFISLGPLYIVLTLPGKDTFLIAVILFANSFYFKDKFEINIDVDTDEYIISSMLQNKSLSDAAVIDVMENGYKTQKRIVIANYSFLSDKVLKVAHSKYPEKDTLKLEMKKRNLSLDLAPVSPEELFTF